MVEACTYLSAFPRMLESEDFQSKARLVTIIARAVRYLFSRNSRPTPPYMPRPLVPSTLECWQVVPRAAYTSSIIVDLMTARPSSRHPPYGRAVPPVHACTRRIRTCPGHADFDIPTERVATSGPPPGSGSGGLDHDPWPVFTGLPTDAPGRISRDWMTHTQGTKDHRESSTSCRSGNTCIRETRKQNLLLLLHARNRDKSSTCTFSPSFLRISFMWPFFIITMTGTGHFSVPDMR